MNVPLEGQDGLLEGHCPAQDLVRRPLDGLFEEDFEDGLDQAQVPEKLKVSGLNPEPGLLKTSAEALLNERI